MRGNLNDGKLISKQSGQSTYRINWTESHHCHTLNMNKGRKLQTTLRDSHKRSEQRNGLERRSDNVNNDTSKRKERRKQERNVSTRKKTKTQTKYQINQRTNECIKTKDSPKDTLHNKEYIHIQYIEIEQEELINTTDSISKYESLEKHDLSPTSHKRKSRKAISLCQNCFLLLCGV